MPPSSPPYRRFCSCFVRFCSSGDALHLNNRRKMSSRLTMMSFPLAPWSCRLQNDDDVQWLQGACGVSVQGGFKLFFSLLISAKNSTKDFFLQQGLITFQGRSLLLEESALPKFGVGKKRDRGSGREKNGVEDGAIWNHGASGTGCLRLCHSRQPQSWEEKVS